MVMLSRGSFWRSVSRDWTCGGGAGGFTYVTKSVTVAFCHSTCTIPLLCTGPVMVIGSTGRGGSRAPMSTTSSTKLFAKSQLVDPAKTAYGSPMKISAVAAAVVLYELIPTTPPKVDPTVIDGRRAHTFA